MSSSKNNKEDLMDYNDLQQKGQKNPRFSRKHLVLQNVMLNSMTQGSTMVTLLSWLPLEQ